VCPLSSRVARLRTAWRRRAKPGSADATKNDTEAGTAEAAKLPTTSGMSEIELSSVLTTEVAFDEEFDPTLFRHV
jgi:hypothetical protein